MQYSYYPGCTLTGTAREYDVATRELFQALGVGLMEIPDWTCCGASAAPTTSEALSLLLPARNLALAETRQQESEVMVPCSACYLNLLHVYEKTRTDRRLKSGIRKTMEDEGLTFTGKVRPRHILDVLANDIGAATIAEKVAAPFVDLVIAPYYGCQILRPYPIFDNPERPASMDALLTATGAKPLAWNKGGVCCGASLMTTHKEVALNLVADILKSAETADAIVTVCPMCQMNLESFQQQAFAMSGQKRFVSVLYLPQLIGLALGLSEESLQIGKNMVVTDGLKEKLHKRAEVTV